MYGMSLLGAGNVELALSEVLGMFRHMRFSPSDSARPQIDGNLDESVMHLGQSLSDEKLVYSSQSAVLLFRIMIENGGLVPFITQAAIARIGPECVQTLSEQDIALALHVQAYMLPSQANAGNDTAQAARFAHLLETILNRSIGMDPATIHAVDNALPKLDGTRPDLERRWNTWRRPESAVSQSLSSPRVPLSPQLLESTSGRLETHLSDAMARLKNVRRMGRHLQYSAYAKLITAAGKAKQQRLMHELLAMAQTDVPFNAAITAVRNGWVSIYDSMIAACLSVGERQLAEKFHNDLLAMGAAPSANTFGIYITTLEGTFDELPKRSRSSNVLWQRVSRRLSSCSTLLLASLERPAELMTVFNILVKCRILGSDHLPSRMVPLSTLCVEQARNHLLLRCSMRWRLHRIIDLARALQFNHPIFPQHKARPSKAETVLEDMKANGVLPEAVHYGSLIHAKGCVLSDMVGARAVFDSVIADRTIKPTDNLYQNLLEAMVANHQVAETEIVLTDMYSRVLR
ncbi:hypothetical protein MRB53_040683 [Persea americana]|nr:hypothetical protein MRB53_040683 [Persea americana]